MPGTFTSSYTVNVNLNVFFHLPPSLVCWDSRTETHQSNTCHFLDTMCFDSLCFDMCVSSAVSPGPEVALAREEEVDLTLLKNESGVESALLYAKTWSKYIKDLLAWMDKRLAMGEPLRLLTVHWVAKQRVTALGHYTRCRERM